jgi:hypothetical protein
VRRFAGLGSLVVVLVLLSAFAGAGASAAATTRAPSPNAWATNICTSITAWQKSIVKRSNAMSHVKPKSLRSLHDTFVGFLSGVVHDTDTMIKQTKAAGIPKASHGADVANALQTGFKKLRAFFAADVVRAKRLSSTNATKFSAGAEAIAQTINKQANQITALFDSLDKKYRSPQLDKAMKTVPACRGIS